MRGILITGAAGFIGSHLVDFLLAENQWRVVGIDNFNDFYSPEIKRRNLADAVRNPNFRLVEIDIRNAEKLKFIFKNEKFDAIVHLAANAGVLPSLGEPHLCVQTNVNGTLNLLELARDFEIRQFVFGSSSSVYGINPRVPFNEADSVAQPISPYAVTKAAGEMLCHTFSYLHGIRAICLRFFTVYGARQRPDLAIHKFARLINQEKPIPFYGDGRTRRDYTYVTNVMAGVRAAIDYSESNFEVINLGESRAVELREMVALLEKNLGKRAVIELMPPQPGDVPITYADITKASRLLGYNPAITFETGIRNFVQWYLENDSE